MKVFVDLLLFTDTLYDVNGVSRFIQDLAKEALRQEKGLHVVSASPLNPTVSLENITLVDHWAAIRVPHYPTQFFALPRRSQIKTMIDTHRPKTIHISTPGPVGWTALHYAKRYGCPVTSTYHTDFPDYIAKLTGSRLLRRLTARLMQRFYSQCDLVFTRSAEYRDILESEIKIPKERIILLEAGMDTERFSPTFRDFTVWHNYPQIDPDSLKMLYVGRLSEEKNFPLLLEYFREFRKRRGETERKIELIALGEGAYLADKERWRESGVHLLGVRQGNALSTLYASCDLFVFPSVTETLGQAVMEAQASGLAAIVSDKGGPRSVIDPGNSGYSLPADEMEVWLAAMTRLCDDPHLRHKMGEAGHARMQMHRFSKSFDSFWQAHRQHLWNINTPCVFESSHTPR
jgi:glycosyltransferase involved in cell wall biosynthesis